MIKIKCKEDYYKVLSNLKKEDQETKDNYLRYLCRTDLYFLLWYGLGRTDIAKDWLFDRCREVQDHPDGYLDLWARGHYKSTIITFAKTIQDILGSHGENPLPKFNGKELTFGIFSFKNPIASSFLNQIKQEFEANQTLKYLFPDILYENPSKDSPSWSVQSGITVKRKSNPKERTVEASGLVDGQPISKHYDVIIYDDVITADSVTTSEMIEKVNERWALSLNLIAEGGKFRYIGTRYHFNDTYKLIMERGAATPRVYSCYNNDNEPVLLTQDQVDEKRSCMGSYVFACQMIQNPIADGNQAFLPEWLKYHPYTEDKILELSKEMNKYIVVDGATEKKKDSDYTVMCVWGATKNNNMIVLDVVRDRLNPTERVDTLFKLHRKWKPLKVGYEQYGMMSDIHYIEKKQEETLYYFPVVKLAGRQSKKDRISRLIPDFERERIIIPRQLIKINYEGKVVDIIKQFINEEYLSFPVSIHDDMLDAMSRIYDEEMYLEFPEEEEEEDYNSRMSEYDDCNEVTGY